MIVTTPGVVVPVQMAAVVGAGLAAEIAKRRFEGKLVGPEWTALASELSTALDTWKAIRDDPAGPQIVPHKSPQTEYVKRLCGEGMSTDEMAKKMKCKARWVRTLCARGRLPAERDHRGYWRIYPDRIDHNEGRFDAKGHVDGDAETGCRRGRPGEGPGEPGSPGAGRDQRD